MILQARRRQQAMMPKRHGSRQGLIVAKIMNFRHTLVFSQDINAPAGR